MPLVTRHLPFPRPPHVCTHPLRRDAVPDPSVDTMISSAIHQWGWWGGVDEHRLGLAGGYAAGTPLTAAHAAALRAAAAARAVRSQAPFADTAAAVAAAALPPVLAADRVLSWCSRERPVVLDVGANIGAQDPLRLLPSPILRDVDANRSAPGGGGLHVLVYHFPPTPPPCTPGMFAAHMAASGCTVVAFEPLLENGGRLWQTLRRGGWGRHTFIYKNAVGKAGPVAVSVRYAPRNPGTSRIAETYGAEFDGGGAKTVPMVSLEVCMTCGAAQGPFAPSIRLVSGPGCRLATHAARCFVL